MTPEERKTFRKLALLAFPGWKGRKLHVQTRGEVYYSDLHYDGGSRNQYTWVDMVYGTLNQLPVSLSFGRDSKEGTKQVIPEGFVCVERSVFCGKPPYITIHLPASYAGLETSKW